MNVGVKECSSMSKNSKKFAVIFNHNCVGNQKRSQIFISAEANADAFCSAVGLQMPK